MNKTCPYCGGDAVRRQPMVSPVFSRRSRNFPCESCGAAVRISKTSAWIGLLLKIVGIVVLLGSLFVAFGVTGDLRTGPFLTGCVLFFVLVMGGAFVEWAFKRVLKVEQACWPGAATAAGRAAGSRP